MLTVVDADGSVREFSDPDLKALEWFQIDTHTIWTEGQRQFRGPLLRDILLGQGLQRDDVYDHEIQLLALNDFMVTMPASDAWDYDVILAREMDGSLMRVRDKGPLWVVYPRDDVPELQDRITDERWVWQLMRITILP
ncbi:hypothetical protein JJJ17_17460 [Paracoccus caeni]|uniref:Oxidoreductase molybdopterin-binding domain-containing protein n=1 Tax=Paracoccus caeni TaxID=657651 RepID=A0A934SNU7_9RHOB|nr:hypothetical protein [Paracoccus caeni]